MTSAQKVIKYLAIAFAIFLIVNIISAIIIGLYTLGNVFGLINSEDNTITEELRVISSENAEISTLKIDLGFTNLHIKAGEKFKVETNNSRISFSENNGNIVIKEENHNWFVNGNNQKSSLIVYIPKDMKALDKIRLEAGAGEITIDTLKVKDLYFNLGAGKVQIENIIASQDAKINGGAGKIEIEAGKINNLDLDMGIGEAILQLALTGKSDIDSGIGSLDINLYGEKEDYKIDIDKGIGSVKIEGRELTGDDLSFGYGENYIEIDGGIGNIAIDFEKEKIFQETI